MHSLDCQVTYWNRVGPSKGFHLPVNFDRLAQWVRFDDPILDYGCGYGRVLGELRRRGYRDVLGVDPAVEMIAEARRRFPTVRFEQIAHPPDLDLAAESMAAVLLFGVLTCVPTDEGQHAIIREITRVLRPGGVLYVGDFWLQADARNTERYNRGQLKHGTYGVFDLPEGVTLRHHDRRWIGVLTSGYQVVAVDQTVVETMNGHRANGFHWFGTKREDGSVTTGRSER
jgi:SAM-dependent methyltransferase